MLGGYGYCPVLLSRSSVHNCYNNFLLLLKLPQSSSRTGRPQNPRPHQHYMYCTDAGGGGGGGSWYFIGHHPDLTDLANTRKLSPRTTDHTSGPTTSPGFFVCSLLSAQIWPEWKRNRRTSCSTEQSIYIRSAGHLQNTRLTYYLKSIRKTQCWCSAYLDS